MRHNRGFTPLEITNSHGQSNMDVKNAQQRKSLTGFTLIEMVLAIFFISVGSLGAFALLQKTLTLASISAGQLTASYLAQEGMEIVRNIRDSNWLEQRSNPAILWDQGIDASEGGWEADYTSLSLTRPYADTLLSIDANGFYSYSLGQQTKFKRKIIVAKPTPDLIRISTEVYWDERGRTHKVAAQSELANWR